MTEFDKVLSTIPKYIMDCPICAHWVTYRAQVYFATINYEKSINKKKVYLDLAYCATASLNNNFIKTIQYTRMVKLKTFKF